MNIDESYRELGLPAGASEAEAKEAWRRLAARWHPDRNPSPHALRKIQRINRALDEIRRWHATPQEMPVPTRPAPAEPPPPAWSGEPIEHTVALTVEEACNGCTRELHGVLVEDCLACGGAGLQRHETACDQCDGSGRRRPGFWASWFSAGEECDACGGAGLARPPCPSCAGSGKAPSRKYRCRVQVPAGTRAGSVLQVRARVQGRQRRHELALRLHVQLEPHPLFSLDADGTVRCEVPVDGFDWMAERWIAVPTPRGAQQMRLRRGHLSYRIRGEGAAEDTPADCIVTIVPLFPQALSAEQQLLLDRLVASNSGASGTVAGDRMTAWQQALERWQSGRAGQPD